MSDLYRIVAPHFVAGVVTQDGTIITAAPILKWARGKSVAFLVEYCQRKRWGISSVPESQASGSNNNEPAS